MDALNICQLSLLLLFSPFAQFPELSASSEPHRRVVPQAALMDNLKWGALRISLHQHQLLFGDLKDFWSSDCPFGDTSTYDGAFHQ